MTSVLSKILKLGLNGEKLACRHLKKAGYTIIERNYKVKLGEIDIIAEHEDDLVFIEVKTRSSCKFGHPAEAVNQRKQQQIIKVAQEYMASMEFFERPARFDVVAVVASGNEKFDIEIIRDAFTL